MLALALPSASLAAFIAAKTLMRNRHKSFHLLCPLIFWQNRNMDFSAQLKDVIAEKKVNMIILCVAAVRGEWS